MTRTVLVTGGAGLLGGLLTKRFLSQPDFKVVSTHRGGLKDLPTGTGRATWSPCDLADPAAVDALFRDHYFDAVVHAAAAKPDGADDYLQRAVRDNVMATANLVAAACRRGVQRLIYCSTISVYEGEPRSARGFRETDPVAPTSIYGWTKLAGEQVVSLATEDKETSAMSLRLAGLHGPSRDAGVVYHMLKAARSGVALDVAEPASTFNLLFLDDAVRAIELALDVDQGLCGCYNLAGREIITLAELAAEICRTTGSKSATHLGTEAAARNRVMDVSRIETTLGFQPSLLNQHLTAFAAYLADR